MKIRVTFKSPDGVSDSLQDKCNEIIESMPIDHQENLANLNRNDRREMFDEMKEPMEEFISGWVRGGEYVTVEFDTEAGTAAVVPV